MESFNLPDGQLIDQLRSGDQNAFTAIYDRHCSALYRTALRILQDHELAKDVVQEAFISLFEKSNENTIRNLQAYLYQVVKYQCFMQLRSGKISDKHLSQINTIIASNELEEELHAKELQLVLDESIAALPEKCREVFYLSRFESLSNKKIAERLNISHKTVENQITKALKILHVSLDKLVTMAFVVMLGTY
jgi:RNA polymerase sigma-70 factor (ECF subfamily)